MLNGEPRDVFEFAYCLILNGANVTLRRHPIRLLELAQAFEPWRYIRPRRPQEVHKSILKNIWGS